MCKKCLTLIGLWPKSKSSKYHETIAVLRFVLTTLLIVLFVNIVQTAKLLAIWGNLDTMTDIISTANLPIAVAVFKMIVFYKHRKGTKSTIQGYRIYNIMLIAKSMKLLNLSYRSSRLTGKATRPIQR